MKQPVKIEPKKKPAKKSKAKMKSMDDVLAFRKKEYGC